MLPSPKLVRTAILALMISIAQAHCSYPETPVRKEWRTLTKTEQLSYIEAVKCLQAKPSQLSSSLPGARSRYDDFQGVHISATDRIHFNGIFHPWHRLFVVQYENALRDECGWTLGQPYWDWTLDADSEDAFLASPIWDPVMGFGGNGIYVNTTGYAETNVPFPIPGKTGGGRILDGPFVNHTVNMGPGSSTKYNPQCLTRDFSPWLVTQTLNTSVIEMVLSKDSFAVFDFFAQADATGVSTLTYHGGGHMGVGGDIGTMGNMYSSPGDPIFFLHHANLDRMWNVWQRRNWDVRKSDIAGPDTMFAYPWFILGDLPYTNITLSTVLDMANLTENVPIGTVMDTDKLCYQYV